MSTCAELAALVPLVKDPAFYLTADGSDGSNGWQPIVLQSISTYADYQIHFGVGARKPWERAVSKLTLTSPAEVWADVRLISAYYENPSNLPGWQGSGLRTCSDAQGWFFVEGRKRALDGLASYGAAYGFGPDVVGGVVPMLLAIFADPSGSRPGSKETEVVYSAADLVRRARTAALDASMWIPLWGWAVGGPNGNAAIRTRVGAMKAIQAILRRKSLMVGQIKAADSLAAVLRGLVTSGAVNVSSAERDLYISEAQATVGAAAAALIQAYADASVGIPPVDKDKPQSWVPSWIVAYWPIAAAVSAALVAGTATVATITRRRHALTA